MMRVLVTGDDQTALRAAASLAAHPDIAVVGVTDFNPPSGWAGRMTRATSSDGFDVVVGRSDTSVRSVTVDTAGTVTHAGPIGLAHCLGTRLSGAVRLAITEPGRSRRSPRFFDFPPPVGRLLSRPAPDGVERCPTEGALAAVAAGDGTRILAVIDHPPFLDGVCLAAGVLLVSHPGPVWDRPERYLEACADMGLVIAESLPG
jgi:hypothetical protein